MKKFFAIFTVVTMLLVGGLFINQDTSSAASSVVTYLKKDQTSSSTKRITVKKGQSLRLVVSSYGSSGKRMKWTIFKNGKAWTTNLLNPPINFGHTFKPGAGQYSVRLYCGINGGEKGCSGMAGLSVH
ncbi:hypothetical protein MOE82_20940 [Bacillus licheniformis]|uniref:hypothetical protein n=1 Tax=Bacillus licheniformis TaxID=1402 RepID=UPI00092B6D2F|nr:hypothetical protein [Bacillus licheniformis]MCY7776024.1 hypothetical protein [Bacillus licheniformis]MCY7956602.1 hypothetical protein [Bacillus licheniformis]MCY8020735.1 hypothetical protein [Bacillus licheniformis]MCY8160413.1 hypothetical protein [Bacillus licheniformis]MCY8528926.1 hypothetical protein [Bacillus licheniformis]